MRCQNPDQAPEIKAPVIQEPDMSDLKKPIGWTGRRWTGIESAWLILWVWVVACGLTGCTASQRYEKMSQRERLIHDLAVAYGVDQFDQVERIDFTFNVRLGDHENSRSWSWRPRTNLVNFDNRFTYHRDQLLGEADESIHNADRKFINDSFWLLLPLHLTWSQDVTVQDTGEAMPPLGVQPAKRVLATYSASGGGYTPGDLYELFLNDQNRVTQWVFHRRGVEAPTLVCTWEAYQQVGPLWLAMDHVNKKTGFRLWFTDVTVWTRDGQTFSAAGP